MVATRTLAFQGRREVHVTRDRRPWKDIVQVDGSSFETKPRLKLGVVPVLIGVLVASSGSVAGRKIDFGRDVAPIFEKHCLLCHKAGGAEGAFLLATAAGLRELEQVVPGQPDESPLIAVVAGSEDQRPTMPKSGTPLTKTQVETLRRWIQEGANWPDQVALPLLWSLAPLKPVARGGPEVVGESANGSREPIDQFVLKRLRTQGLNFAPEATRHELIRRLKYDFLGLPPTPEEIAEFVNDRRADAWERLVDRFLASPHYGERWAQHWMDVVRFSESDAFEDDAPRPHAWPYRDYVISSFNKDKPYDQFVREQIAGDVMATITHDSIIATSMLVIGPFDPAAPVSASNVEKLRSREVMLAELLTTVGQSILGLTLNCARCHDHKFDPIPQADYYRIKAVFDGVHQAELSVFHAQPVLLTPDDAASWKKTQTALTTKEAALDRLREERAALGDKESQSAASRQLDDQIAVVEREIKEMQWQLELVPKALIGIRTAPSPTVVFERGNILTPGEPVIPGGLSAIQGLPSDLGVDDTSDEAERRRRFALWITDRRNPLTPRVIVNRVWHHHFGNGIVDTPSDFGVNGGRPSHPELLDWLAARFMADGWSLKRLHRRILMSAAWRQSSVYRTRASSVDADNRLLWRFTPRRLDAESVRDAMLLASGELNQTFGGPSYRPFTTTQMNTVFYHLFDKDDPVFNRRTIYRMRINTGRDPLLDALDCPAPSVLTPRRRQTVTPLQALDLMNDTFVLRQAAKLAARIKRNDADLVRQIETAWLRTIGRNPRMDEVARAADVVRRSDLKTLCWVLFNSSEFLQVR